MEPRVAKRFSSFALSSEITLDWAAVPWRDSRRRMLIATMHKHIPKIAKPAGSDTKALT
jgi:hypothetical protein